MSVHPASITHLLALALLVACLHAPFAYAVNHNPTEQTSNVRSTDVTLTNPRFVSSGSSYTASVVVDGGTYPDLLAMGDITVSVLNDDTSEVVASRSVSSAGTVTFSLGVESDCGCRIRFKIEGLTGGSADSDPASLQDGSGHGVGSVNSYYDLGKTPSGGSAGQLLLYTKRPTANLYTPAAIELLVTDASVEVIRTGSPAVARQVLSLTQLTDVVPLSTDSYEIRFYEASQKGTKSGGLYQPVGMPFKVARIENPGIAPVANTVDDALYVDARWERQFGYALPLPDGPYKVRLHFAELYHDVIGAAVFNVKAEGQAALSDYDVLAAAGSRNTARVEEITTTVRDGELNLDFSTVIYGAQLAALEVLRDGAVAIAGTGDDVLYQSERTGDFSYALTLPDGDYEVRLHFSESTYNASGKRVFNVAAEGVAVLGDYDIYAQAGAANAAHVESIPVTLADGQLDLVFTGVTGAASLSALTVIDTASSSVVAAINVGGPAYTAADSTVYAADTGFIGGEARSPGQLLHAINAGGEAYTAADSTVFSADYGYVGGFAYLGALNRMKITETEGSTSQVYEYSWITEPRTGAFGEALLTHPGGLKKEGKMTVYSQDEQTYVETRTLRDGLDNLVAKTATHYEKFPFGFRKVSEVIDPDGAALTTTWTYVEGSANPDDPRPDGYGQEKSMARYDGYWEEHAYDGEGRLIKTVSRYLDSTTRHEADNQVETIAYGTSNPTRTRVTTIQGQEVARTYEAEFDDAVSHEFERWTITAVTPGAAWNAADNLVSKTRTYKSSHPTAVLQGQTKWGVRPDGTRTLYAYASGAGTRTVTTDTGAPNVGGTAIVAGTRTVATYNEANQQIEEEVIDLASGLTVSEWVALTVDDLGRPTLIGHGDGTTREIAYVGSSASCGSCSGSGTWLVASETDRNGVTTTYAYDALNRRTETIHLGVTEKLVYDAADRVVQRIRIGSDASEIVQEKTTYDLAGRVIAVEDALENETAIAYSYPVGGGAVTTTTFPATAAGSGTRIETRYADGRVKEIAGTAVSPLRYAYGTWSATGQAGQWTQEIKVGAADSEAEWVKSYADLAGRQVKTEYPDSAYAAFAYNPLGQLVSQTDPDGVATLFAYNAEGQREVTAIDLDQNGVIDHAGTDRITKTATDVYNKSGTVVRRTSTQVWATDNSDTATTVSVAEQDGYGNQSWQTDAAGAISSTAIVRTGAGAWTITVTAPDGSQQVQTYTGGRLTSSATCTSTFTLITQTTFGYDAHNRVETQTDARTGDTHYTYNDRDEVVSVTVNDGADTTAYTYDGLGNQLTVTLPDSSVTTNEYHLRNSLLKKTSGSQAYPVEYTYDLQGRTKTLTTWQNATTSAEAAVTTWNYDSQRGWLTQKLYADNQGPTYSYSDAGRLLTRTWVRTVSGAPLVTTYTYNTAGDLISTDYSDTTPDVAISYTRFGGQKTVTDATGTRTFNYTAALRPDQEQLPAFYGDRILTRSYQGTGLGEVPGRTDGFALGVISDLDQDYSVVYGYDNTGRFSSVTDPNGTFTYGYLANSNLRSSVSSAVHSSTWTYESHRNVIASLENKVGVTTVSKFDYTVNSLGQRTQRQQSGTAFATTSTDVFAYNAKGEVIGSTNTTLPTRDQAFNYDDIGNRLSRVVAGGVDPGDTTSYTANTLNQHTAIASAAPSYDADGNQTSTGLGQIYIWDAENRLISVEPFIPNTGDKKAVNTYDAQSRRVRRAVFTYTGSGWSLATDEKFIYDGRNVVAVLDASSVSPFALSRTYTWGLDLSDSLQGAGGVGGLLSAKDGGAVYHYTYDANGNISEVLNNTGGIAAHYEYDAFGNTVASSGVYSSVNEYRFSTKSLDQVSGLYYYGFRYYNPDTGRWLSRDPIEERGGLNLYGMIGNDVLNALDYLGLSRVFFFPPGTTLQDKINRIFTEYEKDANNPPDKSDTPQGCAWDQKRVTYRTCKLTTRTIEDVNLPLYPDSPSPPGEYGGRANFPNGGNYGTPYFGMSNTRLVVRTATRTWSQCVKKCAKLESVEDEGLNHMSPFMWSECKTFIWKE